MDRGLSNGDIAIGVPCPHYQTGILHDKGLGTISHENKGSKFPQYLVADQPVPLSRIGSLPLKAQVPFCGNWGRVGNRTDVYGCKHCVAVISGSHPSQPHARSIVAKSEAFFFLIFSFSILYLDL